MDYWKNMSIDNLFDIHEGVIYVEEWVDIAGYEGLYQVSSFGRVKALGKGRSRQSKLKIKAQCDNGDGYLIVCLTKDGIKRSPKVHIMVAKAFIPNPHNKLEVNHKKGIKTDNRHHQLEWNTRNENMQHSYDEGLRRSANYGKFGKDNPKSFLVNQCDMDGNVIAIFHGTREAARITGINGGNIRNCCRGGQKHAGGFIWRYVNN
jgi:hypothetical protein